MFSKKLLASAAVISFAVAGAASAQETTSAVRGNVRSTDGTPVAGAQVTVTHGPTGAVSAEYADAAGVFDLRGLRVGGPYTIEVTADDFQGQRMENVFLEVGTPFRIALDLEPSDAEIIVTATRSGLSDSVGSGSVLNRADIESTVSVTRDIRDLARRDPLVTQNSRGDGGISIGGSNPRTNRITIDGVQAQDDFGLNTGGLPTRRGPISIDAVRQFAVEAVPFDVENGDFIGGAINIVLREGGNDFEGSAFINYLNEGLVGTRIQGQRVDNTIVQDNWGATLRGPLWRDRLFFALSYETYESQDPTSVGPAGLGFATLINGPNTTATPGGVPNAPMTQAEIDAVTNVFGTTYGSTFPFGEISLTKPITDEKYTGRFDWNITDDHLATLTFRHSESALRQRTNLNATSAGLDSQWYTTGEDDYTTALQVNSRWTDALSTETRISFRDYTRLQEPPAGQDFADIRVCSRPATNDAAQQNPLLNCRNNTQAVAVVRFGPDLNRHANFLHTENTQAQFSAEYQVGSHLFKAGAQYQDQQIFNIFLPNSDGAYYFDSIDDFSGASQGTTGVTAYASELVYRNALSGNPNDAAADFAYATTSLFAQDTWDITDRLTLNYGVRYDTYTVDEKPALNPNFVTRHGRANQVTYDGRDVIMPRFSATYDINDDMRLSGGVGLFSGGLPDVFISNVFANTGILDNTITFQRSLVSGGATSLATPYGFITEISGAVNCSSAVANQYGSFTGQQVCLAALNVPVNSAFGDNVPAEVQAALGGSSASPTSETNVFAPNFEIPSIWKANLSFNWDFHRNLSFGADFLAFQDEQGLAYRDIRAQRLIINGNQALLPDGRIRYDGLTLTSGQRTAAGITSVNPGANRDIEAFNPDENPVSWIASVNLQGSWDNGIEAGISYARQNIDEYSNGARFSSTANSLYSSQFAAEDPNTATRGRGQEEITDSFKYNFSFRHDFVADLETRFTFLGEWRTGRPVSFTMSGGSARNNVFGVNRGAQLAWVSNLENMTQVAGGATLTTTDDIWRTADNRMTFAGNDTVTRANGAETAGADGVIDDIARLRDALNQFGLTTGGIVPRGAYENNDIHRLDLQISQELPTLFRGHRTLLTFDFANVLNLLNDEWGVISEYTEDVRLFNVACADLNGGTGATAGTVTCQTYRVSGINNTQTEQRNTDLSRWAIQIGLKYEF